MKKIIILILLALALLLAIFATEPTNAMGMGLIETIGLTKAKIAMFYVFASSFLIWVGWPVGWNFAVNCGYEFVGRMICGYIGLLFAIPIAIFQLLKSNN